LAALTPLQILPQILHWAVVLDFGIRPLLSLGLNPDSLDYEKWSLKVGFWVVALGRFRAISKLAIFNIV
jgi:hypothetical protein